MNRHIFNLVFAALAFTAFVPSSVLAQIVTPAGLQPGDHFNLIFITSEVWKSINASASRCPMDLRVVLRHIRSCAEDRYGSFIRTVKYTSVSGFLFLRFFCPAILNPKLHGLIHGEQNSTRFRLAITNFINSRSPARSH